MADTDHRNDQTGSSESTGQKLAHWAIVLLRGLCLLVGLASAFLSVVADKEFWPVSVFFLFICLLCFWFAFRGHIAPDRLLICFGAASGIVFGLLGFFGGLFWAGYRHPDSNIAPVMAYLSTAPMGFSIGVILGVFLGHSFHSRKDRQAPNKRMESNG